MTEQQLPEGWQMVKFGDIAKHISKRVEPSETDLEIYVGLEHLDPDSLKIKRHGVPSDVEGQKLLVKKGQIIFGKRRAYQRKVAVADWDCICSAHAMVLEANTRNVIPEFLPFFMQSDVFMNRAVAVSEGSLSPTIKWKVLAEQTFPLPSRDEQKSALQLMNKLDSLTDIQESVLESLSLLKIKTENELFFGNHNYGSAGFMSHVDKHKGSVVKLGNIISSPTGGVSVKSIEGVLNEEQLGVLKTSCVKSGAFIASEVKVVMPEEVQRVKTHVEKDTVIFSRMNTPDLVGESGYVDRTIQNVFLPDRLWSFKSVDSEVTTKCIAHYLSSHQVRKKLNSLGTGTSASMKNISKPKLLGIMFPKYKDDFSKKIESVLSSIEKTEINVLERIKTIRLLKYAILHQLLGM